MKVELKMICETAHTPYSEIIIKEMRHAHEVDEVIYILKHMRAVLVQQQLK